METVNKTSDLAFFGTRIWHWTPRENLATLTTIVSRIGRIILLVDSDFPPPQKKMFSEGDHLAHPRLAELQADPSAVGVCRSGKRCRARDRSGVDAHGSGGGGTGSMSKLAVDGGKVGGVGGVERGAHNRQAGEQRCSVQESPCGSSVNFDTSSAMGSSLPTNPVLPLFTQLNVRFPKLEPHKEQLAWKEVSRWVQKRETFQSHMFNFCDGVLGFH